MPQYCGLVRTLHKTVTVTSVSVTGLRSSRTRANKLVSIVSRFFWLVLSNLISLSRSWEHKTKKYLSLHSSLDCSRERWVSHRGRSLRSKRFSVVSEQKENEERRGTGFSVLAARKVEREPKNETGVGQRVGEVSFLSFPPLPALLLATFFARSFDTRSLFFAPKRHGNAWYADYRGRGSRRLVSGSEGLWFLIYYESSWYATPLYKLPYYRKLTLHEIKVLKINATLINANLMENDFRIKKINA